MASNQYLIGIGQNLTGALLFTPSAADPLSGLTNGSPCFLKNTFTTGATAAEWQAFTGTITGAAPVTTSTVTYLGQTAQSYTTPTGFSRAGTYSFVFWDSGTSPTTASNWDQNLLNDSVQFDGTDFVTGGGGATINVTVIAPTASNAQSAVQADLTMRLVQNRDYPLASPQCPSWLLTDFDYTTIDSVTLQLYPIADYEAGITNSLTTYTGLASSSDGNALLSVPLTAADTAALQGGAFNLPTHIYSLCIEVNSAKINVASEVCRVQVAA